MPAAPARRVLIAGVGNVLRRDDGFGPAVLARLVDLPAGVELLESGIGGMALLQELLGSAWDGLIVLDAVERGAPPGTVFVIEPEVSPAEHVPDTHLVNADRVLALAKRMEVLPERVVLVGCQPRIVEATGEPLSPEVERALPAAVAQVRQVLAEWTADRAPGRAERAPAGGARSVGRDRGGTGRARSTGRSDEGGRMGHKEHADERSADAAMADPQEVEVDPDAIEAQPEQAKETPGGRPDEDAGQSETS